MSRLLIGLPKNTGQRIESETTEIIKLMKQYSFTEQPFERPYRKFTCGLHTVRFSISEGVALYNSTHHFKGLEYGDIISHIKKTHDN